MKRALTAYSTRTVSV